MWRDLVCIFNDFHMAQVLHHHYAVSRGALDSDGKTGDIISAGSVGPMTMIDLGLASPGPGWTICLPKQEPSSL